MIETLLSATKTPAARNRPSPAALNPTHRHRSIVLESRLEESEARRIDSEERVQQLENARRDGPSSAVISSRWRGTLPDREGLWTGDNPDRLVTFTTFGKSYLSLLCDISTSDLFTTDRVIQLVATLFVRSTSPKRRQSPHDWAVDTMTDALRDERPHCWTTLMTEVGRRWPDPGFAEPSVPRLLRVPTVFVSRLRPCGRMACRYRAFMHNDPSFSLSPLQLATTFLSIVEEVRTNWSRPSRRLPTGPPSPTTPARHQFRPPPIRTATYGAIAKTPRTAPSTRTTTHVLRSVELDG
ncbi:BZ3501_MvSof-1269-A2-R1_C56g00311 [Microbotryum saponariae]|nr:BZ3501_MvSof-1269-A2-R1_C56g00311 [Microbotryum saponariae]